MTVIDESYEGDAELDVNRQDSTTASEDLVKKERPPPGATGANAIAVGMPSSSSSSSNRG